MESKREKLKKAKDLMLSYEYRGMATDIIRDLDTTRFQYNKALKGGKKDIHITIIETIIELLEARVKRLKRSFNRLNHE